MGAEKSVTLRHLAAVSATTDPRVALRPRVAPSLETSRIGVGQNPGGRRPNQITGSLTTGSLAPFAGNGFRATSTEGEAHALGPGRCWRINGIAFRPRRAPCVVLSADVRSSSLPPPMNDVPLPPKKHKPKPFFAPFQKKKDLALSGPQRSQTPTPSLKPQSQPFLPSPQKANPFNPTLSPAHRKPQSQPFLRPTERTFSGPQKAPISTLSSAHRKPQSQPFLRPTESPNLNPFFGPQEDQKSKADTGMSGACGDLGEAPKMRAQCKRMCKGHINKVNSVHFSGDSRHLVSGSLDGKLIIWDIFTGNKTQIIPLRIHWDVKTGKKVHEYFGHSGDVATMSLSSDHSVFATGSVDRTIKVWDLRDPKTCKQTFWGHTSDVNSVYMHPSNMAIASGSEDKTARLWDLRSDQQVCEYKPPTANSGFTCCGMSKSGRYIICGSDDNTIHVWDSMKGTHAGSLQGHENRITSLAVAESGIAFATSSWDMSVRVWAL
ncbi:putative guanine nucleotide-binding protein subunit beta-2 [Penaeus vannamei]|uniref:Putative guanine nucleotide-binding protein subunit beta-2 n=1 Tax=Penaeus vannamei TaxID=6689 RepID=A0A423TVS2_PENVA|nr:putative guanine nucleotide-binding protein subunit beta-2 [Penaeus vannamei]